MKKLNAANTSTSIMYHYKPLPKMYGNKDGKK